MNARDPVCGVEVDTLRARAVAIVDGKTFYFCSAAHKEQFLRAPAAASESKAPSPVEPPHAPAAPTVAPAAVAPAPVEEAPVAEAKKARRRSPLGYVVVVLLLFAGVVLAAVFARR